MIFFDTYNIPTLAFSSCYNDLFFTGFGKLQCLEQFYHPAITLDGYSTACWNISGDVVVDISFITVNSGTNLHKISICITKSAHYDISLNWMKINGEGFYLWSFWRSILATKAMPFCCAISWKDLRGLKLCSWHMCSVYAWHLLVPKRPTQTTKCRFLHMSLAVSPTGVQKNGGLTATPRNSWLPAGDTMTVNGVVQEKMLCPCFVLSWDVL